MLRNRRMTKAGMSELAEEKDDKPKIKMENTFKMVPDDGTKFASCKVKTEIYKIFENYPSFSSANSDIPAFVIRLFLSISVAEADNFMKEDLLLFLTFGIFGVFRSLLFTEDSVESSRKFTD
jgi:hypothetical protein